MDEPAALDDMSSDELLSPSARVPIRRISNPTRIIIMTKKVSQMSYDGYLYHDLSSSGITNECSARSMMKSISRC
jgi:hypothetical protein